MENSPLFSIVTVVYNDAQNLEKTINSVVNQTFKDFEYIVIDGGSKDNTLAVINQYRSHISYSISEPDKGIYDAMNKGIRVAKGRFVNFLNAGDIYFNPNSLQLVSDSLDKSGDTEILYGQAMRLSEESGTLRFIKGGKISPLNLFTSIPFCHQAIFYQKKLFKEIGLYDQSFKVTADYQWLIRYSNARKSLEKIHFIPEPLVEYGEGGYSFQNIRRAASEKLQIADKHFPFPYKLAGLVSFGFYYLKVDGIRLLQQLNLLQAYRSVKYKLLNRSF